MYKVGDKIFYPMYGAGIIQDIERKDVLGEEIDYYVIYTSHSAIKVMIPVESCEDIGMRHIVDQKTINDIIETLNEPSSIMPNNWNKRRRENKEKMQSGDIFLLAEVIRNLSNLSVEKSLSPGEKKLLEDAIKIFESEVMLVKDIALEDAHQLVANSLVC